MSNQQPLSNSEIHELSKKIAVLLKKTDVQEEEILRAIEEAVAAKVIEENLNQYILLPKYKGI